MGRMTNNFFFQVAAQIHEQKLPMVEKNRLLNCLNEVATALGGRRQQLISVTNADEQNVYAYVAAGHPCGIRADTFRCFGVPISETYLSKVQATLDKLLDAGLVQKYNNGYYALAGTGLGQGIANAK